MSRAFIHECKNRRCGGDLADKTNAYDDVNGEIVSRPVWKCRCCGQETKRIVRKSAKALAIEIGLQARLNKLRARAAPV